MEQTNFNWPSTVISVDFETTGLNTMYDSPISLACVVLTDGEPTGEVFSTRIRVPMKTKISIEALVVQGADVCDPAQLAKKIAELMPTDAPDQKETMRQLAAWAQSNRLTTTPIVCHKATFDWGFYDQLSRNTTAYEGTVLSPIWICTKELSRQAMAGEKGALNLASQCARYGIEGRKSSEHDALEDATLCGKLYFKLVEAING